MVVDDEAETIQGCEFTLASAGMSHVIGCRDSRKVLRIIDTEDVSTILLDLSMPHVSGHTLLEKLSAEYPHIPVIILTGMNQVDTAVECMKRGAFDYMVKPVETSRMISGVKRAVEMREERMEYTTFRRKVLDDRLEHPEVFEGIITRNKQMRSIFQYVETISGTAKPVLITGESGVGKEMIARAIHPLSQRRGSFVGINVAGLEEQLFSDTLFGHLKGAFTSAAESRKGLVARARGGLLFMDEIGDLSAPNQLKLLRLLQEKEYYPVGSDVPIEADVRIIAATNQDLQALQRQDRFRTDLYYRLQTHHVYIPPLRERMGDLPLLINYFLEKSAQSLHKKIPAVPPELVPLLASYSFPGNIRELEALIFDAVSHHQSKVLSLERFKMHIRIHGGPVAGQRQDAPDNDAESPFSWMETLPTLKEAPKLLIQAAMHRCKGNTHAAARMLGITRSGLNKAIKRGNLSV
ncbi:MAG: sigma-54-dependent Fis family transcriptional regulator [Desulfobacteraceae bacterium]|nr:sigma-54-dependent Fis family transcriptional regulator [Desulfobacteraceae bacterium]